MRQCRRRQHGGGAAGSPIVRSLGAWPARQRVSSSPPPPPLALLLVLVTLCGAGAPFAVAKPDIPSAAAGGGANEAARALHYCAAPEDVVHRVWRFCGATPTTDALLAAGLSASVADMAVSVLLRLGFETVLDLRLAVGQQLQTELAAELKTSGLSIGDRAKIQLLVGEGSAVSTTNRYRPSPWTELHDGVAGDEDAFLPTSRRQQQTNGDGGMSTDTLAIVLSVLVGAAGCESPHYSLGRDAVDSFCGTDNFGWRRRSAGLYSASSGES
eukprot:SAG31_NODE_7439_length_1689_cov_1.104403_1_plen_270_part_00